MNERTELRVTLATGVSRCGKTIFFLRYLTHKFAKHGDGHVFVFDPLGHMAHATGFPSSETVEELEQDLDALGWVFFDPSTLFPGDQAAGFDWFCKWSYDRARSMSGAKALLCDEIWMYQSAHRLPQPLACWIQDGAKWNCEVCLATHDPDKLNSSIKGQITEVVCFYLQQKKALEYVADFGLNPEEVKRLPNGSFIAIDPRSRGELRGKVF